MTVAVSIPLLLTGCSSGGDQTAGGGPSSTAAAADPEERMRAFTACMRKEGVNVPDPEPGGMVKLGEGTEDPEKMEAAMTACRSLLPDGGAPPKLSGEDLEKARAMATCMRENGVEVPDPDPSKGGAVVVPRGGPGAPDPEKMQKAFEACRHLGPAAG